MVFQNIEVPINWDQTHPWLVVYLYPSEKYESQLGIRHSLLNGKKIMFQTTNQTQIIHHLLGYTSHHTATKNPIENPILSH
jgi:hypothetical protein